MLQVIVPQIDVLVKLYATKCSFRLWSVDTLRHFCDTVLVDWYVRCWCRCSLNLISDYIQISLRIITQVAHLGLESTWSVFILTCYLLDRVILANQADLNLLYALVFSCQLTVTTLSLSCWIRLICTHDLYRPHCRCSRLCWILLKSFAHQTRTTELT